jgi:mycothiol synthase
MYPMSEEEVAGNYIILAEDVFEEHWVADLGAEPNAVVVAFNPDNSSPANRLCFDLALGGDDPETLRHAADLIDSIQERTGLPSSTWTADLKPLRMAELEARGFRLVQRVPVTRLDLTTFDSAPFEEKRRGIRIRTAEELDQEGFDWIPSQHRATSEMLEDMPSPHPPPLVTEEQLRKMLENKAIYHRHLMFMALDGDRVVGYSRVTPSSEIPGLVTTGLTGVVRSHRRRGIATAIKITAIERVRELGYMELQTDNDETNPMYGLNLALGFRPRWHWLQYERKSKL